MNSNTIIEPGSQPVLRGWIKELFVLRLPHTHAILSPNANAPLTKRGAIGAAVNKVAVKRAAKGLARVLALNAGLGKATVRPDSYRIVWCYVGNPPDLDNLPSRCKAYLDSICAVLGMDDVKIEHMEVYRVHDKARAGYVFLAFGQWVETGSCGGCCRAEGGAPNLENIACEVCARTERGYFYEKEELV